MSTVRIQVLKVNQNSTTFFLGKINAEEIKEYATVDRYRSDLPLDHIKQGYQRAEEPVRYKKFANFLIKEVQPFCPTALLLSSQDIDLKYDDDKSCVELNSDNKLQIVDGQHRVAGYRHAIYEKKVEKLIGFEVPIIIVPNMSKITEMKQFAVINGTQKSVSTALVNMILTQIAERSGEDKISDKDLDKVIITRVVEELNKLDGSPWKNLIIMPNEKGYTKKEIRENPKLGNIKIIRATSFMTSLRPIYKYFDDHEFLQGDAKEQSHLFSLYLIEFWKAVKSLVPDAFKNPSKYVIQKTPGLFSLHTICNRLLKRLHGANLKWEECNFNNILQKSESLTNPEFWCADGGEASKYGSMKGFSELANVIDEELTKS